MNTTAILEWSASVRVIETSGAEGRFSRPRPGRAEALDPYVSVIVTAYNRRRYLPEALRSLEAQTLDKGRFEVIVVKNFEDAVSDAIIRRNGWRWVYSDERSQGRFALAGLEEARGEVLTFLEDDDMYVPERLHAVKKAFEEVNDLVYFHNAQVVIDEEGRVVGTNGAGPDLLVNDPAMHCRELFVDPGGFHNASSIAFSSALADKLAEALAGVGSSIDLMIMVVAAVSGGKMLLSGRALTMWRVHGASSTPHSYSSREGGWRESVSGLARAYSAWARDAAHALELLAEHPCRPYAEHLELVRRLEASAAPDWALQDRPRSSPVDFLRAVRLRLGGRMKGDLKLMAVLAVDSFVARAPNPVREAWWRLRWRLGRS